MRPEESLALSNFLWSEFGVKATTREWVEVQLKQWPPVSFHASSIYLEVGKTKQVYRSTTIEKNKKKLTNLNIFLPIHRQKIFLSDHPCLHLPILARELLNRGALLADGAWWWIDGGEPMGVSRGHGGTPNHRCLANFMENPNLRWWLGVHSSGITRNMKPETEVEVFIWCSQNPILGLRLKHTKPAI